MAAFGGLPELLFHLGRAPTPDARAAALTALTWAAGAQAATSGLYGPMLTMSHPQSHAAHGHLGEGCASLLRLVRVLVWC